ncbi:MAG: hypothetical protein IKN39_04735 [Clostridia bacterium]|nr:hypothetical protein [Clostridia bacterium]
MKKILCALLCIILLFVLAGCKEKKTLAKTGVDIAYYAELGFVPESEIKLSDNVPENSEDSDYYFSSDNSLSFFSNGSFNYYYDSAAVTAIAAFSNMYGFEAGDVSIELTDTLDSQGLKYTEREPKDGELYFLPNGNFTVIECNGLKNNLIFVLEDNSLCAALLSQKK